MWVRLTGCLKWSMAQEGRGDGLICTFSFGGGQK